MNTFLMWLLNLYIRLRFKQAELAMLNILAPVIQVAGYIILLEFFIALDKSVIEYFFPDMEQLSFSESKLAGIGLIIDIVKFVVYLVLSWQLSYKLVHMYFSRK